MKIMITIGELIGELIVIIMEVVLEILCFLLPPYKKDKK